MWRLGIFLAGLILIALSGVLVYARREASAIYFILGEYHDSSNFDYTIHYYIYTPDGRRLVPLEGMYYQGDYPYFDLYWSPDARHFYYTDVYTSPFKVLSLNGRRQATIINSTDTLNPVRPSISPDRQH